MAKRINPATKTAGANTLAPPLCALSMYEIGFTPVFRGVWGLLVRVAPVDDEGRRVNIRADQHPADTPARHRLADHADLIKRVNKPTGAWIANVELALEHRSRGLAFALDHTDRVFQHLIRLIQHRRAGE